VGFYFDCWLLIINRGDFMAHVAKYTKTQVGAMTRHYERAKKENGEYQTFGNQDIDISRSHLNYNLAPIRYIDVDVGLGAGSDDVNVDLSKDSVNAGLDLSVGSFNGMVGSDGHSYGVGASGVVQTQLEFIKQRTSEVKCHNRDDVNVMCSWVVTAPAGIASKIVYDDKGKQSKLLFEGVEAEKRLRLFFEESYKFLNARYAGGSEKNVVSAYVHMDETTPHMHYAFVPVVWDRVRSKSKGKGKTREDDTKVNALTVVDGRIEKVSAKLAVHMQDLKTFHFHLDKHMTEVFGRDIGILNEATKEGNKEVHELKKERDGARFKAEREEINATHRLELEEATATLKTEVVEAKAELVGLKSELETEKRQLEGRIAREKITNRLEDGLREKKSLIGNKTSIVITVENMTAEEAKAVLNAARDRDRMSVSRDNALKERDGAIINEKEAVKDKNDMRITLNKERANIEKKERDITAREKDVEDKQKTADQTQIEAEALYGQQLNINHLYLDALSERDGYKDAYETVRTNVVNLTKNNKTLSDNITNLQAELKNAYVSLGAMAKANGSLLWDDDSSLKIDSLTPAQERLLKATRNYAANFARRAGFEDIAKDIEKHYGITQGMQEQITELMPKPKEIDRGWDMEL